MRSDLGIETVLTGYGLTESSGVVSISCAEDNAETIATTCGKPLDGTEVKILDDDGRKLPLGSPGDIVVRGYNVMAGYHDDPKATRDAIDADGWLHTGDVGALDAHGYLRITDRKKDMFIVGGFNCYPAEIERMLLTHPAIQQAAVIGIADDRLGEVAKAYVVPKPDTALTAEDVLAWSRDNMANYKVPRIVVVREALPMNAAGKVQKFMLKAET